MNRIPKIVGREEKSLELCTSSPDGRTVAFAGNDGFVILYDAQRKQWIADLKLNGSVRAIAFSPNDDGGRYLWASGTDGDVYKWDLRKNRKCLQRFPNIDGTPCSSLAVSTQHLAVGSQSGVVNLYSCPSDPPRPTRRQQRKQMVGGTAQQTTPIKSILNLQTAIHATCFNCDGQIMAMSTQREQQGLKLLHVPTATVFANWPAGGTPLNYVWSMDFSPNSLFMAVGNDKGKCLLYQLKHYWT